ncbi:MAG TPA: ATP-binding protein [Sphingomicrobium sp.]|nr:ATP-binding protein [Sphingomicrobium sp.]
MSQEHLGLFDTPPDRHEIRLGLAVVALLFALLIFILPLRNIQLGAIDAFIPIINTAMLVGELIIATLLYSQATVFRSRALTVLASGYVFSALMLVPHALTFPGAFTPTGLLGAEVSTTAWLAMFRRYAIPIAIVSYAFLKRADLAALAETRHSPRILEGVLAAITLAVLMTALATVGHNWLPSLAVNARNGVPSHLVIANSVTILLSASAMMLLFRQLRSVLDMWLLVVLSDWVASSLLNLAVHTRFTLGFYYLFGMMMVSNLVVMIALLTESNRLHARLALSTAASQREREARLLSMDAVTASVSHEVGQPLAAVRLNASAALRWLDRKKPDVGRAISSLRTVSDAAERTFAIIKSIRATFAREPSHAVEFNINDLLIETASLLDRELAADKISLNLALDESLPLVLGDRVQLQRVLVNLVMNAIEALRTAPSQSRQIAISSSPQGDNDVLVLISDSGPGIAAEDMSRIFEVFFTTKSTGTGLGLPLCRIIVEEHGGRLWASSSELQGASFHIRLPRSGAQEMLSDSVDQALTSLENSLAWLRRAESDNSSELIAELEHVAHEIRHTMRGLKR